MRHQPGQRQPLARHAVDGDALVEHLLQRAVRGHIPGRAVVAQAPLGDDGHVVGLQRHRQLMQHADHGAAVRHELAHQQQPVGLVRRVEVGQGLIHQQHLRLHSERPLSQLSGGERQRVLLARALAVNSPVLLMDEPLANLDPPHQADWLLLVRSLVAQGCTVVSVLHELSMALHADDVAVLAGGRLQHHGAAHDPATHRALEAVFDERIAIHRLKDQWLALPRLHAPAFAT